MLQILKWCSYFIIIIHSFSNIDINAQSSINEIDQIKITSVADGMFLLPTSESNLAHFVVGDKFNIQNETHLFYARREGKVVKEINMVAYALSPVSSDFQRVLCEDDLNVVHLHGYHGKNNQQWSFEEYPPGKNTWFITSLSSFKVLQNNGLGKQVSVEDVNLDSTKQRWIITYY